MTCVQPLTVPIEACLQGNMHHFEHKIPIHRCPVDIFKLNSRTRCPIDPTDMSTDKALDILRSRQFFHEGHFAPYANHPLGHTPCCVSHGLPTMPLPPDVPLSLDPR
jgi:hypothetical protein